MLNLDTTLSELASQGYTRIEQMIDAETVQMLLDLVTCLRAEAKQVDEDRTPFLNRGHQLIYNLQNKDIRFLQVVLRNVDLRSILMAILNDEWYRQIPPTQPNYIMRSYNARNGGERPLPLHIDSFIPSSGSYCWSLQASIVLQDQSVENGATVFVPGSHLLDRYADQEALSRAVPISSSAGDVVIWDSRTWHGTSANTVGESRWAVIATFARWWLKPYYDLPRGLPQAIYEQLSPEERAVVGYCSIPPRDETERLDIKGGYDDLRERVTDYFLT